MPMARPRVRPRWHFSDRLASLMQEVIQGNLASFGPVPAQAIPQPYAAGWNELFDILLK